MMYKGNTMTIREALDVFLNLDKNKLGEGGRNADKKIKDKGKLGDRRPRRSVKTTYGDYNDVAMSTDDSEYQSGRPPLPRGY